MTWPLYCFETLPSTSTLAMEKLKDHSGDEGFAIQADCQSEGRGQRGKTWKSPEGNLYLSICFPAKVSQAHSLEIGFLLREFIFIHYGLYLGLKWPNDLIYLGDKVAGILGEATSLDSKPWHCWGIGLNLVKSFSDNDFSSKSLYQLVNEDKRLESSLWDARRVARKLVDFLNHKLGHSFKDLTRKTILSFANTSLWQNGQGGEDFQMSQLGDDGSLHLRGLSDDKRKEQLISASHQFSIIHQRNSDFWIADIGNSKTKIWHMSRNAAEWQATTISFSDLRLAEQSLGSDNIKIKPIAFGSVNKAQSRLFFEMAQSKGFIGLEIEKKTRRVRLQKYPLEQIGIDRLAAMEGLLHKYSEIGNAQLAIIVSFGTATTVDFLKGDGIHLGGWIVPGLENAAQSLAAGTGQLPAIEPKLFEQSIFDLGQDTQKAIAQGILAAQIGLIHSAYQLANREGFISKDISLYLTGGQAMLMSKYLNEYEPRLDDQLVAWGLALMAYL